MNTKIYKEVHTLAEKLMQAAEKEDRPAFDLLFATLHSLCLKHEGSDADHPVQWETLADFTEDLAPAIEIYAKALGMAEAINSKDFCSSIGFSMASLQVELGEVEAAIENLENAKIASNKIADKVLKAEIHDLLEELQKG